MLGICKKCGTVEDAAIEEANAPGFLCSKCFVKYTADSSGNIKSRCPDHPDGHHFIPCDEWPATCTCGEEEK